MIWKISRQPQWLSNSWRQLTWSPTGSTPGLPGKISSETQYSECVVDLRAAALCLYITCFLSRLPHPHPALAPLSPSRWVADHLTPTFLMNLEICVHCLLSGLSLKGLSLKCLNSNSRRATQTLPGSNFGHLLIQNFNSCVLHGSISTKYIITQTTFLRFFSPEVLAQAQSGSAPAMPPLPTQKVLLHFPHYHAFFLFFRCYPIWVYLYICRFIHTLLQVLTLEEIERQAAAVRI